MRDNFHQNKYSSFCHAVFRTASIFLFTVFYGPRHEDGVTREESGVIKKLVHILLLVFILSSCSFHNKMALNLYYEENLLGSSSLEIFKKYGAANEMWRDSFNNSIFSYSYTKPRYNFASFFPLLNAKSKFDNYEVILVFDEKGKLIEVKKFYDRLLAKSWLICESKNFDCDLSKEVVARK